MTRAALALGLGVWLTVAATARAALEIYFIDVEGGQATLVITPAGETLLADAGYGGRVGSRDADRILAAAAAAGVTRIDYLLVTHFHPDHAGGVAQLDGRIPIDTFIDYGTPLGEDRMAIGTFRSYEPVRLRGRHLVPAPGDRLPLAGVEARVVSSGGAVLTEPLPGGGNTPAGCDAVEDTPPDGTENYRSIGVMLTLGSFRFLNLGDLSGNTLASLVCPSNLLGTASVYLIAHHGDYDSNLPALYDAVRPRVAIMNNGVRKGGAPEAFATVRQSAVEDLWQLHFSRNEGVVNAPDDFIANVDDGSSAWWLRLTAREDGSFRIVNSRTGFSRDYAGTEPGPAASGSAQAGRAGPTGRRTDPRLQQGYGEGLAPPLSCSTVRGHEHDRRAGPRFLRSGFPCRGAARRCQGRAGRLRPLPPARHEHRCAPEVLGRSARGTGDDARAVSGDRIPQRLRAAAAGPSGAEDHHG
ncbi:MAG: MBL fold metallo-hydrolase [Candidatus Sericytochromatia bacterium]|uniref:MBL fold metallo-hydrolase n=1 Tax=Candidatus Tanganyikabacteria bacterium TaxID=2961651 RepID=A0A937X9V2_9BACT|nr:MBL fold metallo-hydrolase [Candidatus Tanganyikabacteria bacterium]MBM3776628.1 MBL fold metallo-hydrolase [Acidimicrobiia bacterium]